MNKELCVIHVEEYPDGSIGVGLHGPQLKLIMALAELLKKMDDEKLVIELAILELLEYQNSKKK